MNNKIEKYLRFARIALLTTFVALVSPISFSQEMQVPVQLRLKAPDGSLPTTVTDFRLLILSPGTNCVLRDENFVAQSISNGNLSLSLGSGIRGPLDPSLSLNQIYDNSRIKTGLSCIDSSNSVVSSDQSYSPTSSDQRIVRITTRVGSDNIIADVPMKATPYAIQAESVGGKHASEILVATSGTELSQANLQDLLLDSTRFNNLKNLAISGVPSAPVLSVAGRTGAITLSNVDVAGLGTAATLNAGTGANNLVQLDGSGKILNSLLPAGLLNSSSLHSGDVSGTVSSLSVDRIKGIPVSSTTPTTGQVLQYDGTQYMPVNLPIAPVSSVAGRTGAVILSNTDISGLGNASTRNVGTTSGTVAAGDDLRFPYLFGNSADQVFTSTTSANVTGMSFAVVAGRKYKFSIQVYFSSAATTTGIRLGLIAPATTLFSSQVNIPFGNDGNGAFFQGVINSSGDSVISTAVPATSILLATIEGQIIPSANGTVQLQAATEIAGSAVTIRNGSFIEITERP